MDYSTLKTLRRAKKITQTTMGKELGISRELLGLYEQGKSVPRVDTLERWCALVDCELIIKLK